jgi:hypothetical protein
MAFRPILSPKRIKMTTASTRKAVVYPVMNPVFRPLKVRIIRIRAKTPNMIPAIVRG